MKYLYFKLAAAICCIFAFIAILGLVGDYDYCEQVILRMSQEDYDSVKNLLTDMNHGSAPSQRDIAHWWDEHHNNP